MTGGTANIRRTAHSFSPVPGGEGRGEGPAREDAQVCRSARCDAATARNARLPARPFTLTLFPEYGGEGIRAAIVALLLVVPAVAHFFSDRASSLFQFDRANVAAGQFWRVFTCHWTHWSLDHLVWDAAAFAVLVCACHLRCRTRLAWTMVIATLAIPAAVWVATPGIETYRGLSGLVSAMAVLLVVDAVRGSRATAVGWTCGLLLTLFAGKIAFELMTGQTMFVDSAAAGFVPVPLAHAMGGAVGCVVGLLRTRDEPGA